MTTTREIRATWENQPDGIPDFLNENCDLFPIIESGRKKENETLVQEFSQKIQKKLRRKPKDKERQNEWEQDLEQDFMQLMEREKILNLSEWMSPELLDAFKNETKHFVNRVREFDETLTPARKFAQRKFRTRCEGSELSNRKKRCRENYDNLQKQRFGISLCFHLWLRECKRRREKF